ncbi:hypothetical protein TRVL_02945 [Trypanosoma vivax]|uniref:Transmembrane protein 135 N-terminal domain-containing protein n=1 Tax=Trypanosoma vivax (strain Y486) TaxID=1055687 RepID=G0U4E9_TRYVY|nr:hypothetical protein TRVL_02945 [Trypanosoma vivax]CCC52313.1 conserved hypothetical protein [Trypanosoma vivax Y486]
MTTSKLILNNEKDTITIKLIKQTVLNILRNAVYTALGRVLLGLLKVIGRHGLRVKLSELLWQELSSLGPLKWSAVAAGFSSFRLVRHIILLLLPAASLFRELSYLPAAFLCAIPAALMDKTTRTELCLCVCTRAFYTLVVGHILPLFPSLFRKFGHYDIVTLCLSSSQILYGFIFAPHTIPPSFRKFLSDVSLLDYRVVHGFSGLARCQIAPELVELCFEKGYALPDSPCEHLKVGCRYIHPGSTCNKHLLKSLLRCMLLVGFPLTVPLKVIFTLIFHMKKLKREPTEVLRNLLKSTLSSCLFLAIYSVYGTRCACFIAQRNIRSGLFYAAVNFPVGFGALIEPKSRRIDLAHYCFSYAVRSFFMTQHELGRLPYPRHCIIFTLYLLSIAFLYFQYDHDPNAIEPRTRRILNNCIGESKGVAQGNAR